MTSFDLSAVPTSILDELMGHLERMTATQEVSAARLASWALEPLLEEVQSALSGAAAGAARAAVQATLATRASPRTNPELVWSGEDWNLHSQARDAEVVMAEIFGNARREVLLTGYSVSDRRLFEPLKHVMASHGVRTQFFLNFDQTAVDGSSPKRASPLSVASIAADAERALRGIGLGGAERPAVYYDTRLLDGGDFCSVHAKVVVVDQRVTLVTSANLTRRGHERNVELGILLEDEIFARRVVHQFNALVQRGRFAECPARAVDG